MVAKPAQHAYLYFKNLNSIFTRTFIKIPTGLIFEVYIISINEVFKQRLGCPYSKFCKEKASNQEIGTTSIIPLSFLLTIKILSQQ